MSRIENLFNETLENNNIETLESIHTWVDSLQDNKIEKVVNDKNNISISKSSIKEPYIVFTRFFKDGLTGNEDFLLFEIYAEGEGPGKGHPLMQGFGTRDTVWKMIYSFMACANITQEALQNGVVMGCINIVEKRETPSSDGILRWNGIPIFRHEEEK